MIAQLNHFDGERYMAWSLGENTNNLDFYCTETLSIILIFYTLEAKQVAQMP